MRAVAVALLAVLGAACAPAAPVARALDRPAVLLRDPARAVLLGIARFGERIVAVGERGVIVASDDAGASWRQSPSPVSVTLTAVQFADAQTVYAVGHSGVVLASADAGRSWERRLDGRRAAELVLEAANAQGESRSIADARRLLQDGPDKPFFDLHFFDASRGVVVGAYGLAFTTDDGGRHWRSLMPNLPNPDGLHLYALRVSGDSWLVAGEQGLVLHSVDSGRSFTRMLTPYSGSFFTAEMSGPRDMIVAGLRGNAWRSRDGGATWRRLDNEMPVNIVGSTLLQDGHVLFADQAGTVFEALSTQLAPVNADRSASVSAFLPLDSTTILTVGAQGIGRTKVQVHP